MSVFKAALVGGSGSMPDWVPETLEKEGVTFVVEECTTKEELARVAGDADVVWVYGGSKVISAENMDAIPRCGAVIRTGSGTDNIAVEEATKRGIIVSNTPAASEEEVSDHAIGLLFSVVRQITIQDRLMRRGAWDLMAAFPRWRIRGMTAGLIGFGHISRCLVNKMHGFEFTTLVYDPYVDPGIIKHHGAEPVPLDEVMSRSDWVSVHCPLLPATRRLIGEREFRLMKPTAIFINTARGPIVDEAALIRALKEKRIAGAGLDVFEEEPTPKDNPLFGFDNVVMTPHTAGHSEANTEDNWRLSVETVIAFSQGRWPRSYVNHDVKPKWTLK